MRIDFEITYRGETANLSETASKMLVSFTLYDGNFPNGGGGGAVDSVNGKTGTVVLNADDIAETSTRKWLTATLNGYYDSAYAWVNTNGANVLQSISELTTAEVETILFKTITPTVITSKTVETCIYSIPLPIDSFNYMIEVSSRAQISLMGGSAISHRLRVGTYLSPIDGASGADAIGNQTVLGFKSESTSVGFPVTRRFKYFGGATGSIFGISASTNTNDDNVSSSTSTTLKSADLTTQHYLYVSFNPSAIGAIVTHLMLTIKVIKI